MTRGIKNVSGVSCHISCALQILLHSLIPICDALTKKENGPHPSRPLHQMSEFAKELRDDSPPDDENPLSPVDPSPLYKMLKDFRSSTAKSTLSLEPEDVGDASTAILMLLKLLRQQSKDWASLVDLCSMGSMRYSIKGEYHIAASDGSNKKRIRIKPGKIKQMPFPFPISGEYQSLDEALKTALQPTEVVGYNWQSQKPESYEEICYDEAGQVVELKDDDCNSDNYDSKTEWKTEKALHIEELPHYCFFHLDRFSYDSMGDKTLLNPTVEIPPSLELSALQSKAEGSLQLLGGILHVSEGGKIEEEGHYVTLVRIDEDVWVLIDDETCTEIRSDETAMERLKGTTDDSGNFVCATLVAFGPLDQKANTNHRDRMFHRIVGQIQSQTPEEVVGKRILVKWAKEKFYAGIVKGYHAATGKHSILYDDGDVKQYVLSQKIAEFP
ncbi:unnamed protein product [Cylindrotheca closterium]|uniref:ubiquitinyl hydrolase 1 n=1 Tax=Cylindrotheca closterium TaxID=2856 RepID=A0AAD2G8J1_9STRA|nr:unnamed protein product [Cylindrotheca closterium]